MLTGYTFLGRPIDVVETSRGCTFDCSFCSIIEMRGRNFHTWSIERVLDDIRDAHARGARAIFLVDDNITLNIRRFEALCRAIVDNGLNDIDYLVQAMTSSIASAGETLAPLMREAGFRYVFLGIENILDGDLAFLRASAKNAARRDGRQVGNASEAAIDILHRHKMYVVGGLIVGNPTDTRESIEANLAFARAQVDWPYIQHPTPYPGTPMTKDFRDRGLVVNDRVEEYDGTTAVVRTEHLAAEDIEFLRWRAERWMKMRHFWPTLSHSPRFVLERRCGRCCGTRSGAARCARSSASRPIVRCSRGIRRSGAWSARATASEFGHGFRHGAGKSPATRLRCDFSDIAVPVCEHGPIMVAEALRRLRPAPGDVAVDCTLGGGGHALAMLERIQPGGRLFGLDVDPIELRRTEAACVPPAMARDVRRLPRQLRSAAAASSPRRDSPPADLILADLGVSSMQIDDPGTRVSYKASGPLDMRIDPVARRAGVAS